MNSDSDIRIDAGGSFRRFESVDCDSAIECGLIPPQPLRPAPLPPPTPPPIPLVRLIYLSFTTITVFKKLSGTSNFTLKKVFYIYIEVLQLPKL